MKRAEIEFMKYGCIVPVPAGEVRILQLTDIQIIDASQQRYVGRLRGGEEIRWLPENVWENAFRFVDEAVSRTDPHLLVITGDNVYGEFDDSGAQNRAFVKFIDSFRIPWATVFGNHDNGYYNYRDFTSDELRSALEQNGVTILEDESVQIRDGLYLVGRQDAGVPQRADAQTLTAALDPASYIIMADHQPNDYANEAESGADLVLSGHTHGGHIFPAGQIGLLTGVNDRIYGTETRGSTSFFVTSGISGWAIPFKTGTFSEICIIDIAEAGASAS